MPRLVCHWAEDLCMERVVCALAMSNLTGSLVAMSVSLSNRLQTGSWTLRVLLFNFILWFVFIFFFLVILFCSYYHVCFRLFLSCQFSYQHWFRFVIMIHVLTFLHVLIITLTTLMLMSLVFLLNMCSLSSSSSSCSSFDLACSLCPPICIDVYLNLSSMIYISLCPSIRDVSVPMST